MTHPGGGHSVGYIRMLDGDGMLRLTNALSVDVC